MALNTYGALLEGIRFSTGNNVYTFPPDDSIIDTTVFGAITERSEYLVSAGTLNAAKKQFDIADPDLVFNWTCNEPTVTRFEYDGYSNRWSPMPGIAPRVVGALSNSSRLVIPVPNPSKAADAPFSLYLDESVRVTFNLSFIGAADFTDPGLLPALVVEVKSDGSLNFSAADVAANKDKTVKLTGQNFVSKLQTKGNIGTLPDFSVTSYRIFMNPRPASGQVPLVRIGYGPRLQPEEVASESLLTPPAAGIVRWSADTGRLMFSDADVAAHLEESIYYDGVFLGSRQFSRYSVTVAAAYPSISFTLLAAVGVTDMRRFILFAENAGVRKYFSPSALQKLSSAPTSGWYYIDSTTGNFYLSATDVAAFSGWTFGCVDARLEIGSPGVAVTMRRSSVNTPGVSSVPDFVVTYEVVQTLSDNLNTSPFMMLPTTPVVDDEFKLQIQMGTGSFVGDLMDSSDSVKPGLGYLLDLDTKRMKYANRTSPRAVQLQKAQSSIKLEGAALNPRGVTVKRNGATLSPSDFDLDTSSGLVEFVEPVGEGDVNSRDVSGTVSGNTFTATTSVFLNTDVGKRLLVSSGSNSGIYDVRTASGTTVTVSPSFSTPGVVNASVRATDETLADRMWTSVSSTPKKFSLYRSSSGPSGIFVQSTIDEYSVKQNVGQVNITRAASPGESIRINYTSLDSTDEGVTTTPTSRVELALFKVSQETPTFSVGSKIISFNPGGKTVNQARPIVLYIEGVTQDSTSYTFTAPGIIVLKDTITSGPVTIDYWIEEAIGGETTIDLLYSPIEYDALKVTGPVPGGDPGQTSMSVSGNQTGALAPLCALLIENQDMLYITTSSYDAATDLTTVSFGQSVMNDGTNIKVTGAINSTGFGYVLQFTGSSTYLVVETNAVEIFVSGTNTVRIRGDVSASYKTGVVIDFDGDPYWVSGSTYDSSTNVTTVTTAGSARRNYITSVVKRSVRPVYDPTSNFSTSRQAYTSRGFTLAKMGITQSSVLQQGVDYDLGDDGLIKLKSPVVYGDVLRAMYVARVPQPAGTVFEFNFSHEIAPDDSNGLVGQKLQMSYNLLAPDTFFYRVETVVTMLPEAKEITSSSSGSTSFGPNTASPSSPQTKDAGLPSPWYDTLHYGNLDVVLQRFLKYYHDLIESYENILTDIDGRIVGDGSGRFRYDGNLGHVVQTYADITNDIDDGVVLYYTYFMNPAFPYTQLKTPVYGKMSSPNSLSRIFPTAKTSVSFVGSVVGATNGQQVGNFDTGNLVFVGVTTTARAVAFFTSSLPITGGIQFSIDASSSATELTTVLSGGTSSTGTNGDSAAFIPPFKDGQLVQIFDLDGNLVTTGTVGTIDQTTTPYLIPVIGASTSLQMGSIAQTAADFTSSPTVPNQQSLYNPGFDYTVAYDSGQISYFKFPDGFPVQNNPLQGNEILEAPIAFGNVDMKPKRFPALDGYEISDSGRLAIPRRRLPCELRYYIKELSLLNFGSAKYSGTGTTLTNVVFSTMPVPGDTIEFIDGPNAGFSSTVVSVYGTSIDIAISPAHADLTGSNFVIGSWSDLSGLLTNEIATLNDEVSNLNTAISFFGMLKQTGFGAATTSTTWVDNSTNLLGTDGKLLWVTGGVSSGLYRIRSATAHSVTVDSSYPPLVVGSGLYSIVEPWSFLKEVEFQFVADFYRKTFVFLQSTQTWAAAPSESGVAARKNEIGQRQTYLGTVIGESGSLTSLLRNGDNLYDTRYLWINQRTNRQSGLVQIQGRASLQALDTLTKIEEDQRKAYMMQLLMSAMA